MDEIIYDELPDGSVRQWHPLHACAVLSVLGRPVHVVMSDYSNIKVTTPEDLLVAEAFLRQAHGSMSDMVQSAAHKAKEKLRGKLLHAEEGETE